MIVHCGVDGEEEEDEDEDEAGLNTGRDQHKEEINCVTSLMCQLSDRSLLEAEAEVEEDGLRAHLLETPAEHLHIPERPQTQVQNPLWVLSCTH